MSRSFWAIGLVALGSLLVVGGSLLSTRSRAHAQATEAVVEQSDGGVGSLGNEPAGYREAIDEALREFTSRNFEESRALFARAHALLPNARTERGMGMAEFELRNYPECITHLRAALASQVRPLSDRLRLDSEQMLARAELFVARLKLQARPAATTVIIDGQPVESASDDVLLKVGEHVIELHTSGYEPESRRVTIKAGGGTQTLTVVFTRAVHTAAPPAATSDAPRPRWYKSPWLWAGVGVLAAGTATGVALAATRDEAPRTDGGSTNVVLGAP